MRLLFVLAALAVPLASSPAHTPEAERVAPTANLGTKPIGSRADCRRADIYPVDQHGTPVPKRLDELPPGQLYLSVLREVDGCQSPVIVGRGYGFGTPAPEAAPDYQPRPAPGAGSQLPAIANLRKARPMKPRLLRCARPTPAS